MRIVLVAVLGAKAGRSASPGARPKARPRAVGGRASGRPSSGGLTLFERNSAYYMVVAGNFVCRLEGLAVEAACLAARGCAPETIGECLAIQGAQAARREVAAFFEIVRELERGRLPYENCHFAAEVG